MSIFVRVLGEVRVVPGPGARPAGGRGGKSPLAVRMEIEVQPIFWNTRILYGTRPFHVRYLGMRINLTGKKMREREPPVRPKNWHLSKVEDRI